MQHHTSDAHSTRPLNPIKLFRISTVVIAFLLFFTFLVGQTEAVSASASCDNTHVTIRLSGFPPGNSVQSQITYSNGQTDNRSGMTDGTGSWEIRILRYTNEAFSVTANASAVLPTGESVSASGFVSCSEGAPTPTPTSPPASVEPNASCPAGYTKASGPHHSDVKHDQERKYTFSIPSAGDILVTGWTMEGHPEVGCSPAGDTPFEPHHYCPQKQREESYSVRMRSYPSGSLSTLGTYHDKEDPTKENWWFPAGNFSYGSQPAGDYELNISHYYGNGNSVDFKLVTCFKAESVATPTPTPTSPSYSVTPTPTPDLNPVPEPEVSCPASYTQIGGVYHDSVKSNELHSYGINVPTVGEFLITGAAMEGHPERGCSPSGDTPFEPHSSCSQSQKGENFNVSLVGNLGSYDLGTYYDKRDPDRDNWWFDAGPFSRNVLPGPYTIEIRDPLTNGNSVDFKLVACHRSTMASPTPTPPSGGGGYDYGDAPASYGVARHAQTAGVTLGLLWDSESSSHHSPLAHGDNANGIADEDGISFGGGYIAEHGTTKTVNYTVVNSAHNDDFLQGWIDWNGNGSFEGSESVVPGGSIVFYQNPSPQSGSFNFTVPSSALCGYTFARFRLSSDPVSPTGSHHSGEVEDYKFYVECDEVLPTPTQPLSTVTPTHTPSPTPSPTPVRSDMAIKVDVIKPSSSPPTIQLSDKVELETSVRNLGYSPSSNMVVNFDFPTELEVSPSDITQHNGWSCNLTFNQVRCTKWTMGVSTAWERVLTVTGRVPGTYQPNLVSGQADVTNDNYDPVLSNNVDNYSIDVQKVWVSGDVPSPSLFLHARYSDSLSSLTEAEADFLPDDIVPNPFQVDFDASLGMTLPSTPYLTTEFCADNPTSDGCDQDTDRIYGTMLLKRYEISGMTQVDISDKSVIGTNLVSSTSEVDLGPDGHGRFTEANPDDCEDWRSIMSGQGYCVTVLDEIDSSWTLPEKDLYEWVDSDYTRIVMQSRGGRSTDCPTPLPVGGCIFSDEGRPGFYELAGDVDFQIIFNDEDNRLVTSPYIVDSNLPFTFYLQLVASFIEPEK